MNAMVKKALSDKNVLYVILFIACAVLLGYLVNNDFESIIFFCIVGFLLSQFSKNMTVVLGGTIIATSLFKSMRVSREGFKNEISDKMVVKLREAADNDEELKGMLDDDGLVLKDKNLDALKTVLTNNDTTINETKTAIRKLIESPSTEDDNISKSDKSDKSVAEGTEPNRGMRPSRRAAQRAEAGGASLDATKNEKTLKMAGNMIDRLEGMLGRVEKFGGMFGGGN